MSSSSIFVATHVYVMFLNMFLVGGWTTHLKNMLVKLDHETRKIGVNIKNVRVATT